MHTDAALKRLDSGALASDDMLRVGCIGRSRKIVISSAPWATKIGGGFRSLADEFQLCRPALDLADLVALASTPRRTRIISCTEIQTGGGVPRLYDTIRPTVRGGDGPNVSRLDASAPAEFTNWHGSVHGLADL